MEPDFSGAWIDAFCSCSRSESRRATIGRILGNVISRKIVASVSRGREIVACGYGAVERDHVGLFDIVVKEGMRGQGFGERLVSAILGRASSMGIGTSYLQVMANNAPALGLYKKLGFREYYRYWYRKR